MEAIVAKVKDPVCGMEFDSEKSEHTSRFKGKTYYFCCPKCKAAFEREPQRYATD
jgi:YHS domain-containing protein